MKKEEFISKLREQLKGLPKDDIDNRLSFYSEMIDDRVAEGSSEEQAISDIGGVEKVVNDIAKDTPLLKLVKEKVKPKRTLKTWEIVLLILGFPLWFPLVTTFVLLCIIFYLLIWVFDLAIYAVEVALVVGGIAELIIGFVSMANGGIFMVHLGAALTALGASFLFIFACIGVTYITISFSKSIIGAVKKSFMKGSK